ncbi:MAG: (2Fe-2S)-binding protein [Thermomicrobiales bacterium]|nr:(2Fe-2S)-binding protein [Thermomicrobiales bacterium]
MSHGAARIELHPLIGAAVRADEVSITFDGGPLPARRGESLLAALLAAGIRAVRSMPVTGELRGGYCLVGRCSDCMVIVDGVPNVRACVTPVCAGMVVETQHGLGYWPERTS